MSSLYSFSDPWPGAMAELAALTRSGPPRSPKAEKGPVGDPETVLGHDTPLELPAGTEQDRVSGDHGDRVHSPVDMEPTPGSPPAMATVKGELVLELLCVLRATQVVHEQQCELLRAALAQ